MNDEKLTIRACEKKIGRRWCQNHTKNTKKNMEPNIPCHWLKQCFVLFSDVFQIRLTNKHNTTIGGHRGDRTVPSLVRSTDN